MTDIYDCSNFTCDITNVRKVLKKYGVAIIPNVLNDEECHNIINGTWDFFEHISQTWENSIKRDDTSTWRSIYDLYPLHSQLFQHWNVGHAQVSWDVRQNPKVVDIFSHIWRCNNEDLYVSFDGLSMCLPPEVTNKGWQNKTWFHTDQSYTRNNLECIQGWVTANDINAKDGTLSVMLGSHKYHEDFGIEHNCNSKADWYKLNQSEEQFYVDKNCPYKKIVCPKGSLVLWDSRTIHCGSNPIKGREEHNIRNVIYVCYMPKNLCSVKDTIKKQNLFRDKRTTSHWPCKPKGFPKQPRTYGGIIPEITVIPEPILTPLGESLAGLS